MINEDLLSSLKKYTSNVKNRFSYLCEEEIFQIGSLAIVKARDTYKEKRDVKFSTFAMECAKNSIKNHIDVENRRRNIVKTNSSIITDILFPIDTVDRGMNDIVESKMIYGEIENKLSDLEYGIIYKKFIQGKNNEEIANELDTTRFNVWARINGIYKKLQKDQEIQQLYKEGLYKDD